HFSLSCGVQGGALFLHRARCDAAPRCQLTLKGCMRGSRLAHQTSSRQATHRRKGRPKFEETPMPSRHISLALAAAAITAVLAAVPARAQAPATLAGQVSSAAARAMEGGVLSPKREGSTATVSV